MNAIPCSETQLHRLQELIVQAEHTVTGRYLKRFRIVAQLCQGIRNVEIARKEGAEEALVCTIKSGLLRTGVDAEILKLEKLLKPRPAPTKKGKRGAPGFKRWEEFALSEGNKVDKEPFIELATLIIAPHASVAVLAVRDPHWDLKKAIRLICTACSEDECRGTYLSGFDRIFSEMLYGLEQGADLLEAFGDPHQSPEINPVKGRFGEGVSFCILQSGSSEACEDLVKLLFPKNEPFQLIPVDETLDFFEQLAGIFYRLRVRWSCIGLFPCVWEMYNEMAVWEETYFADWFVWETSRDEIEGCTRAARVAQNYLASNGTLFSLTPSLWQELPYHEEADFRTLTVRPRVDVIRHDPKRNEVELSIRPLPEFGYTVTKIWKGDPEELAKLYREAGPTRFHYSARPFGESKGESPTEPESLKTSDIPDISNVRRVLLVTRHFLSYKPVVPLETIRDLAARNDPGVFRERVQLGDREISFLVLNMPKLLEAIRVVFRSNFYGDRHWELLYSQMKLCTHNFLTSKGRDVLIAGIMQHMQEFAGPYYYFSALDLTDSQASREVMTRRKHRETALEGKAEMGFEPRENPNLPGEAFEYREDATFLALLSDFDADFLLAGLGMEVRERIDQTAFKWAEAVADVVIKKYWNADTGKPDMALLVRAMPESWRTSSNSFEDEIVSAAVEALNIFRDNRKRVIRTAIETAQRLVLSGFAPATIAVEDETSILKTWRSFVRKRIRGSLLEVVKRRKAEPGYADVEAIRSNRKKKSVSESDSAGPHEVDQHDQPEIEFGNEGAEDDQDPIEDICTVVDELLAHGSRDDLLVRFDVLTRELSSASWLVALEQIEESHPGVRSQIVKALRVCKGGAGRMSREMLEKLRCLFTKP